MDNVRLGRAGLCVPKVIMGSMALGAARADERRYCAALHAGLDAGIFAIDTAPLYDLGVCQERVGRVLAQRGERILVFSKVGLRWTDTYGRVMFQTRDRHGRRVLVRKDSRPVAVRRDVHESLRRLGVEQLDLVHVHAYDRSTPVAETVGALKELLHEGKIGAIGLATEFGPAEIRAAQRELPDVGLTSLLLGYNAVDRSCERRLLPLARREGIGVLAHTCLGRGLLTGALQTRGAAPFSADDFRACDPHFHPDNLRKVLRRLAEVVDPIARANDISIAQTMLAWTLAREPIDGLVVGASTPTQARANAAAAGVVLTRDELRAIDRAFRRLRIDPHAGLSIGERTRLAASRLPQRAVRRLVRTVGTLHDHLRAAPSR